MGDSAQEYQWELRKNNDGTIPRNTTKLVTYNTIGELSDEGMIREAGTPSRWVYDWGQVEEPLQVHPHNTQDELWAYYDKISKQRSMNWTRQQDQVDWAIDYHDERLGKCPEIEYECNNVAKNNPI